MAKVSVVIPAYNCGRYIAESVKSVLDQSYRDLELIVIDDGSTDGTEKSVKTYSGDLRVKYIRKPERRGLPAARNTGIEAARGDLIAFLDADDMFLKDKIRQQVDVFEKDKTCGICYTNQIYFNEDTGREALSTRYHFSGDVFYYLKRSNFIPASAVMVRSDILRANKFDESLESHEDWELYLRLALNGVRFLYIDEPLAKIRVRGGSMTINSQTMEATRREVGMRARFYWKDFKKSLRPFSPGGLLAIMRYLKFKIGAFLIGFPWRECFNRPVHRELLAKPYFGES